MKTYRDHDALCGLALPTADMELRSLVANRLSQCQEYECPDLSSLLHIVVLEEGDTPGELDTELGFTTVHNRWSGLAPDANDFTPSWDVLEEHTHWFELVFVISDDGFGVVVFVPKKNADPLTALCNQYAKSAMTHDT